MKPIACPRCGSRSVQNHGKRYALYPLGPVAVAGIGLAMLHRSSTPHEFHCPDCGSNFTRRTIPARIAYVILLFFGILIGLALALWILSLVLRFR